MGQALAPRVIRDGEGWAHTWGRDRTTVKLTAEETGGWFSLVEDSMEAGWSLGAHHHAFHSETFLVREGLVRFVIAGEAIDAGPGTVVYVPPNTVHEARADVPSRMLMLYSPGGFDLMLRKWSDDAAGVTRPLEAVAFDLHDDG